MQADLERLHKLVGSVAGDIAIALAIRRLTGGKSSVTKWKRILQQAIVSLEHIEGKMK